MAAQPYQLKASHYAELPVQGARIGFTAGLPDTLQNIAGGSAKALLGIEAGVEAALATLGEQDEAFDAANQENLKRNLKLLKRFESYETLSTQAADLFGLAPTDFLSGKGTRAEEEMARTFEEKPYLPLAMEQGGIPAQLSFGLPFGVGKYSALIPLAASSAAGWARTILTEMGLGGATGLLEGLGKQLDLQPETAVDVGAIAEETAYGLGGGVVGGVVGKGLQAGGRALQGARAAGNIGKLIGSEASGGKQFIQAVKQGVAQGGQASTAARGAVMQNMSRRRYKSVKEARAAEQGQRTGPTLEKAPLDTRGQGKQFHGTSQEIGDLDSYRFEDRNIYGQGFYTTDDLATAGTYTKKGGGTGKKIYEIEEINPVKFYDGEAPITKDLKKFIEKDELFGEAYESFSYDPVEGEFKVLEVEPTLVQLFDEVRMMPVSRTVAQESFESVQDELRRQGFGGMSHTGGRLTRSGREHEVKIYFDPKRQVKLKEARAAEAAPLGQEKGVETRPLTEREMQVLKARKQQIDQRKAQGEEAAKVIEKRKEDLASLENKPATVEDAAMASETMARLDEVNSQIEGVKGQKVEVQKRLNEAQTRVKEVKETIATRKDEVKEFKAAKAKATKEIKRLKGIKSKRNAKQRPEQIAALEKEVKTLDRKINSKKDSLAKREVEVEEWKKDVDSHEGSLRQLDNTTRQLELRHKNTLEALDEALGIKQKQEAVAKMTEEVDSLQRAIDEAEEGLPISETEKEIIERVKPLRESDPEQYKSVVESVEADAKLRAEQKATGEKPGPIQKDVIEAKAYNTKSATSFLDKVIDTKMSVYRKSADTVMFLRKIGGGGIADDFNNAMNTPSVVNKIYKDSIEQRTGLSIKQVRQVIKKAGREVQDGKWDDLSPLELRVMKANEDVLSSMHESMVQAGVPVPDKIPNYFPRKRLRPDKYLDELEKDGLINKLTKEEMRKEFDDTFERTIETEDGLMNRLTSERQIKVIPEKMQHLYEGNLESLDAHIRQVGEQLGLARMFKGQDLRQRLPDLIRGKVRKPLEAGEINELQATQISKALNEAYSPNQYSAFMATLNDILNMISLSSGQTAAIQMTVFPRLMSRFGTSETFGAALDYLPGGNRLHTSDLNFKILNDLETNEGVLNALRDHVLLPFNLANRLEASMTLNTANKWLQRNAKLKLSKGKGTTNFERFLETDPSITPEVIESLARGDKFNAKTLNAVLSAARNVGGQVLSKGDKVAFSNTTLGKSAYALKSFQVKNANIMLDRTVGEARKDLGNAAANALKTVALEIAPTAALRVYFASLAGHAIGSGYDYVKEMGNQITETMIPMLNRHSLDALAEGRDPVSVLADTFRAGSSTAARLIGESTRLIAAGEPQAILDPNVNKQFGKIPARWITEPIAAMSEQGPFTKAARLQRTDLNKENTRLGKAAEAAKYNVDPDAALRESPTAAAEVARRKAMTSSMKKYGTTDPIKTAHLKNREKAYQMYERKLEIALSRKVSAGHLTMQQARRIMEGARRNEIPAQVQRMIKEGRLR